MSRGNADDLALIHLAWTPYGIGASERFLASYRAHAAGAEHRLVLALAGPAGDRKPWHDLFAGAAAEIVELGEGIDLDHYRTAVDRVPAKRYCFTNTVTEVLADDWLGHLDHALVDPAVGMVGATGSYETPNAVRPGPLRRLRPGHDPFPNPHLRTNGFAIEGELLRSLDWPVGLGKIEAVKLEGGTHGLTRQVFARGLNVMVVGRDGVAYSPERWPEARTFRIGRQANLLLADNRTRHYAEGGELTRRGLAWLAWGRSPAAAAAAVPVSR